MSATPPDPLATQHDSTPDPDVLAPTDEQTLRLREENRALRELLVAQAQAAPPPPEPGPVRRTFWWLISAPGAALVGWRALVRREDARPITGKRVGYATLTVLYTLAIYGALVLLVVSWSTPNTPVSGATAAGLVRVPLTPAPTSHTEPEIAQPELTSVTAPVPLQIPGSDSDSRSESGTAESRPAPSPAFEPTPAGHKTVPPTQSEHAAMPREATSTADTASAAPRSTLRVIEIPAEDSMAWVGELKNELARCATLGFFERPDCSWAARRQFCEPNRAWGNIKECPNRP